MYFHSQFQWRIDPRMARSLFSIQLYLVFPSQSYSSCSTWSPLSTFLPAWRYAREVLAMVLSLSVTSRCSVEMTEQIDMILCKEATLDLLYTVLEGNVDISKPKSTSLWNYWLERISQLLVDRVAGVVNSVRPTTVASFPHWTSIVVYNTVSVRHAARRAGLSAAVQTCSHPEADLCFLVPWARFPDCAPATCFSLRRFALFLLSPSPL